MVERLLNFVTIRRMDIQKPCLRIFGNLSAGSIKQVEFLLDLNIVKVLTDVLTNANSTSIIKDVLWIFKNISDNPVTIIKRLIHFDGLHNQLINVLYNNNEIKIKSSVLAIYYNLCTKGNIECSNKIISLGILDCIIDMVKYNNLDLQTILICVSLIKAIISELYNDFLDLRTKRNIVYIYETKDLISTLDNILISRKETKILKIVNEIVQIINNVISSDINL